MQADINSAFWSKSGNGRHVRMYVWALNIETERLPCTNIWGTLSLGVNQ